MSRHFRQHWLRTAARTALGQMRRFEAAPSTSAMPPTPDILLSRSKRRSGPIPEVVRRASWSGDLIDEIPRIEICFAGVLERPSNWNQQMGVIVKVVDRANVEAGNPICPNNSRSECYSDSIPPIYRDHHLLDLPLTLARNILPNDQRTISQLKVLARVICDCRVQSSNRPLPQLSWKSTFACTAVLSKRAKLDGKERAGGEAANQVYATSKLFEPKEMRYARPSIYFTAW